MNDSNLEGSNNWRGYVHADYEVIAPLSVLR
jgi:hypothetical protein